MIVSNKKEILFRKNRGKQYYNDYLNKIESFFTVNSQEIVFLPLEESDKIRNSILGKYRNGELIDYKHSDIHYLIERLKCNQGRYYVFIDDDWMYCGAFLIKDLKLVRDDFEFGVIMNNITLIKNELDKKIELDVEYNVQDYDVEYSNFTLF